MCPFRAFFHALSRAGTREEPQNFRKVPGLINHFVYQVCQIKCCLHYLLSKYVIYIYFVNKCIVSLSTEKTCADAKYHIQES